MSDLQLDILAKQRKTLNLEVENSMRAKKVADLKFYNRQRLLYPNAEIFYEPTTYSSLIQNEIQMENTSTERNKGLLETLLLSITTNKTTIIQILNALSDIEIEVLVYFFTDFKNELIKTTNYNAITYDVFIAFTKKYLADKVKIFNNIKKEEIPINNPIFPQADDDLPTNPNIGIMGRNNQNSYPSEKAEKQSRSTTEQTEQNNLPAKKRKATSNATNPKPTKKRAIIENITGKRKNVEQDTNNPPNKKQDTRPLTGPFSFPTDEQRGPYFTHGGSIINTPFSMNEIIENTEMTDFEKLKNITRFYPKVRNLILSPNNPNSFMSYPQASMLLNLFQDRNENYATNKMKIISDKYYKKENSIRGAGNKNRIIFQGKGITDEIGHKKFYVDLKLLNNNILAVKYHSTRNYKMKPTPINDDVKSMVMDILLDKFSQKLFDLLKDDEKTVIIHLVQNMKLENIIPIKDDKLQEYFKQFLILKGEYLSGNNNPQVKRELRKYTLELMDMKKIPKHTGFALLHELSL